MGLRLIVVNRGSVRSTTIEALEGIARANGLPPVKYVTGHLSSADGRCTAVKWLMEQTSDDAIFCDDSVIPPADILGLASHEQDIVAAPTFLVNADVNVPFLNAYRLGVLPNGAEGTVPFDMQFTTRGLQEAYRVGTGCIFIRRRVFHRIHQAGKVPFSFPLDEWGVHTGSEDFWFSDVARELGFKIHADFDRICEHLSTVGLWRQHNGMIRQIVDGALKLATMPKADLEALRRSMAEQDALSAASTGVVH